MTLPDAPTLFLALAAALAGAGAGWAHFASLGRVADLLVAGRMAAVGLQLVRLAALAAFLWLCTRGGAAVLAAGAAGIFAGRALALRRAR